MNGNEHKRARIIEKKCPPRLNLEPLRRIRFHRHQEEFPYFDSKIQSALVNLEHLNGNRNTSIEILPDHDMIARSCLLGTRLSQYIRCFDLVVEYDLQKYSEFTHDEETKTHCRINVPLAVGEYDYPFTINNLVKGKTLDKIIHTLSFGEKCKVLYGILWIVDELHKNKLAHNDLHTQNVMIQKRLDGSIEITLIDLDSIEIHGRRICSPIAQSTQVSSMGYDIYMISKIFEELFMTKNSSWIPISIEQALSIPVKVLKDFFMDHYYEFLENYSIYNEEGSDVTPPFNLDMYI